MAPRLCSRTSSRPRGAWRRSSQRWVIQPKDITYIAMSHYHADHTANANMFAGSTWIVQQAEYDIMFSDAKVGIRMPDTYQDLKNAKRITLNNADHDVFGDGTVIIKTAPGHTPGHQMLFLKLQEVRAAAAGRRPVSSARGEDP